MKTKVYFRVFEAGDVIALFPDEKNHFNCCILSYQRIGQHGDASPALIHELRPAKLSEREDLTRELESIGYILEVLS